MNPEASALKRRDRRRLAVCTLVGLGFGFGCERAVSPPADVPQCTSAPRALISACIRAEDGSDIDQPGEGGVRSLAFSGTVEHTESLAFSQACPGAAAASMQSIGHVPFNSAMFNVVTVATPQRRWRIAMSSGADHIAIEAGAAAELRYRASPYFGGQVAELELRSDNALVAYVAEGLDVGATVYAPELEMGSAGHRCWSGTFLGEELLEYGYIDDLSVVVGGARAVVEPTSVASVGDFAVINEQLWATGDSDATCRDCASRSFLVGAVRVLP